MSGLVQTPDWIALDWGGSHLRAWAVVGGRPVAHVASDAGTGALDRDAFGPALTALVQDWLTEKRCIPAFACGMLGSRQGWVEAPYRTVPCAPLGGGLVAAPQTDPRLQVYVLPGLKQPRPADVMRGEETQIAGFLALNPGWDGVICLPGTHSKWVHVSAGEVVSFQTFLTGETFALLSGQSVLRHGMDGWDDAGFDDGLAQGLDRPDRLLSRLFTLRAEGLLDGLDPATARARLSGLLVGAELAAAKPYWLGQRVAVLGAGDLAALYARALDGLSVPVSAHTAEAATLAGLAAARAAHTKEATCAR
ncbi:putative 2-dehydro-3-deoxygalactonokinase DgoK1 [Roseibaca ekhonensis]|jgi:2-dehydro-3-deoxygalactonokinase|uniref:Putative 2-dehydro-3-deoxygalactonokinase DgoK1 n=1 Tax=Roseinatronobacter ekhonensis TaxID=254356 RepID=A0A3B0MA15_9RHOB|nr:2-dehydro-3-deoxygalactonokinase [Roseibaca ekhonensis]SUZ32765.1 putative 2-dehydro-3-deoxygalactonokinase DgoK1 [Roseibaca ekhonensis]